MVNSLLLQLLTLSLYTLFMGFCFCDGFKLHILTKLLWFGIFLILSVYTIRNKNEFDLAYILPIPTALAILLCSYEKIKRKEANK